MISALKLPNSLLVGCPVVLVVLGLTVGWQNAGILLLTSVVCTMGIGLGFWLLVAVAVGWVILTTVELATGHRRNPPNTDGRAEALLTYVQRCLQTGADPTQIRPHLRLQGWTDAEIDQAFARVQTDPPSNFLEPS